MQKRLMAENCSKNQRSEAPVHIWQSVSLKQGRIVMCLLANKSNRYAKQTLAVITGEPRRALHIDPDTSYSRTPLNLRRPHKHQRVWHRKWGRILPKLVGPWNPEQKLLLPPSQVQ